MKIKGDSSSYDILHDEHNISPLYCPCGTYIRGTYLLNRELSDWAEGGNFLVEETAGIFTTNLSMCKFLSVFNEKRQLHFTIDFAEKLTTLLIFQRDHDVYISAIQIG